MFKIKNLTKDSRKIRVHKTAASYFIRPGEEIIVQHKPIVDNPHIFKVINLDDEEIRTVEKKETKLKEDKK